MREGRGRGGGESYHNKAYFVGVGLFWWGLPGAIGLLAPP